MMADITTKDQSFYSKRQYIGRYEVLGAVDEGKFANIYLSQFQGKQVRIEVLRPPLTGNGKGDFLSQVQALMILDHHSILPVRDVGIDNSNPFLVTDQISFRTLRQMFKFGEAKSRIEFITSLKQIAVALDYMHSQRILHGAIRPENILFDQNNNCLLWGFRIEAIEQNRERLNYYKVEELRDIVAYAAPERIQGKPSPASDLYSLAIVVFELLCGAVPFAGTYIEIADQQLQAIPAFPSLKNTSDKVGQIVTKALAKNPERRFANAQAFIQALETELLGRQDQGGTVPEFVHKPLPPVQPINVSLHQPAVNRASTQAATPLYPTQGGAVMPVSPAPQRQVVFNAPAQQASSFQAQPAPPVEIALPMVEEGALAPRRGENHKVTRRAFAIGLVGFAALAGAGGWYELSKKLTPPAAPVITPNETPPATPETVNNQSALIFTGHLASVNAVSWSPDNKFIASASDDTFVQVFDASSGKRKVIYTGHTREVAAVAWSPNGRLIASGGQDGTVQVWDANSGKKISTYKGHTDRVNGISWSSDNQLIASGSDDKSVQVWNSRNGNLLFNFQGHTAGVVCVGWQPDNSSVASGSWDGTLRDWATVQHGNHFAAGDQIFSYGGHGTSEVAGLAWSPDGNFIASAGADQTVQISNGNDGTPRPPFFIGHRSLQKINPVLAVDWSPGGNDLASGDSLGQVFVWHTAGRKTFFIYRGQKKAVHAVKWSPDGKKIASASADNTVQVWSPA